MRGLDKGRAKAKGNTVSELYLFNNESTKKYSYL